MRNSLDVLLHNIQKRLASLERRPAWLAEKSGLDKGNLSRILKGETSPTLVTLDALAKGFNCEPWELLSEGIANLNGNKQKLIALIPTLDDAVVNALLIGLGINSSTVSADEIEPASRKRR